jgi:hypothetical protein
VQTLIRLPHSQPSDYSDELIAAVASTVFVSCRPMIVRLLLLLLLRPSPLSRHKRNV